MLKTTLPSLDTFPSFPTLPYELRHSIWYQNIPKETSLQPFTKFLSQHILALPRDNFFRRETPELVPNYISTYLKSNPPLNAAFAGCIESRVVALKQVKSLLEKEKSFQKWLRNPSFPYVGKNRPRLVLDQRNGTLLYVCPMITHGKGYHLEEFVFWETKDDITLRTKERVVGEKLAKEEDKRLSRLDAVEEEPADNQGRMSWKRQL